MRKDILRWGLIVFLILSSCYLYVEIQGLMTINGVFPVIKVFSVKSKTALAIIFTLFNLLGAISTSIITALPCGYLARKQSKIIAILIIISMQGIPAYLVFQEPTHGSFITLIWLGQFITGVVSVFALSEIGHRIAAKKQEEAVQQGELKR